MKKKILLIVMLSFMLSAVVSAATLWGSYKGNVKVRVVVSGNTYTTSGVPPVVLNGQVMLPLNVLKLVGIVYSWDDKKKTVAIEKPTSSQEASVQQTTSGFSIKDISREMKKLNIEFVEYVSDGIGFNSITFYYDHTFDDLSKLEGSYETIFRASMKTDATLTKIVDINGRSMKVSNTALADFYAGKITSDQLASEYSYDDPNSQPTGGTTMPAPDTTFTTVTSKIDGNFEGFEEGKLFTLQNGQIWKQSSFDYKYSYKYSPKVTIYKDGSAYYMVVDGVDKQVKVERIK